jgi:hypothetical protein
MEEAVSEEYKQDLREQMIAFTKRKEDEYQQKMTDLTRQLDLQQEAFDKLLALEKKNMQQSLEESLRRTITSDFEHRLRFLQQSNKESEDKLKEARQRELDFLQQEQALRTKETELDLSIQRKLHEERTKLVEDLRKLEEQKTASKETEYQLRLRELEKQLEDQKKLAEEMKRRADQGSMQLQGEVQELALEDLLRTAFPFDLIQEIGKGKRGADCVQTVRNGQGQECGKIIFESKRAEQFSADWIEKLKADMRGQAAQLAVIVTKTLPRDMDRFGEKDGVWICSLAEVRPLVHALRDGIIKIHVATKSQDNKGDKMHLLYHYLTSQEFAEQWKAIREGFLSMKVSIQRERDAMEKLWKSREKQLEKVLLHAAHIKGSVEGIAGQDSIDLGLLEGSEDLTLLDE